MDLYSFLKISHDPPLPRPHLHHVLASNHKSAFIISFLSSSVDFHPSLSTSTSSIHPSIHTSIISHLYNPEKLLFLPRLLWTACPPLYSLYPSFLSYFWMLPFFLSFLAKPRPSSVSLSLLLSEGLKTFLLHCWFWFCKILIMRIMLIIFLLWHNLVCPDLRKWYFNRRRRTVIVSVHISVISFLFLICFILLLFFIVVFWLHKSTLDVSRSSVFSALRRLLIGPGVSRDQTQPSHRVG